MLTVVINLLDERSDKTKNNLFIKVNRTSDYV